MVTIGERHIFELSSLRKEVSVYLLWFMSWDGRLSWSAASANHTWNWDSNIRKWLLESSKWVVGK